MKLLKFFVIGALFGFVLVKTEVISWFRIQEMFRFQSFHMYGVMMSAMAVGITSIFLIKKFNIKTINGQEVKIEPKVFSWGNVFGGLIFGFGWAMTGACPGPLYALVGSGVSVIIIALLSAIFGVFVYGVIKEKLPH
jgi:uncharacterized protein